MLRDVTRLGKAASSREQGDNPDWFGRIRHMRRVRCNTSPPSFYDVAVYLCEDEGAYRAHLRFGTSAISAQADILLSVADGLVQPKTTIDA